MPFRDRVELVGYHDLDKRPGFKLAMQEVDDRWYLYLGHLWHSGWSILDVTDPTRPALVKWLASPPNTWTLQVQVADGLMVTSLEAILPGWGGNPSGPTAAEGLLIWDVSQPDDPALLSHWSTGRGGTHRNYFDGGHTIHACAGFPGFLGNCYTTIDITQPDRPQTGGRWWWPGQNVDAGESFSEWDAQKTRISLHGGAYVENSVAFCPWSAGGMVVLDVKVLSQPQLLSVLNVSPPLGSRIAMHTCVPLADRGLVVVNSEALEERCREPLNFVGLVDISDLRAPHMISIFPLPMVPPGYPVKSFREKGGRFGPHNQHQPQHQACLAPSDQYIYLTYFNAGLQIFDISDPWNPRAAGCYIPDDPIERLGPLPNDLVVQCEDVLVDRRGFIYMTEKNSGLYVLRFDH